MTFNLSALIFTIGLVVNYTMKIIITTVKQDSLGSKKNAKKGSIMK